MESRTVAPSQAHRRLASAPFSLKTPETLLARPSLPPRFASNSPLLINKFTRLRKGRRAGTSQMFRPFFIPRRITHCRKIPALTFLYFLVYYLPGNSTFLLSRFGIGT